MYEKNIIRVEAVQAREALGRMKRRKPELA